MANEPNGKWYETTPTMKTTYTHISGTSATAARVRVMRLNTAGEWSLFQELTTPITMSIANNATATITWLQAGFYALAPSSVYRIDWAFTVGGVEQAWVNGGAFTVNLKPNIPDLVFPVESLAVTGYPLLRFKATDPDDAPGAWFVDPAPFSLAWQTSGTGSGSGQLADPHQVSVAPDGNIWVADIANDRVAKFSPAGSQLQTIAHADANGVAVDSNGDVYVASTGPANLRKYNSAGTQQWSVTPTNSPWNVVIDSTYIWTTTLGGFVEKFQKSNGAFVARFPVGNNVGIAQDGDYLYVTYDSRGQITKYLKDPWTKIWQMRDPGHLGSGVWSVAIRPLSDSIVATNEAQTYLHEYTKNGEYIGSIPLPTGLGSNGIVGVIWLNEDSFVTIDHTSNRLQRFDAPTNAALAALSHLAGEVEIYGPRPINGTFDANITGWSRTTATGWTSALTQTTSGMKSGAGAALLTVTAAPANTSTNVRVELSTQIPVVPGELYDLEGWVKLSDAQLTAAMGLTFYNFSNVAISDQLSPWITYDAQNPWIGQKIRSKAPEGSTYCKIRPIVMRSSAAAFSGTQTVMFDDIVHGESVRYVRGASHLGGGIFSYQCISADMISQGDWRIRYRGKDINNKGDWSRPLVISLVTGPNATILTPTSGQVFNTDTPLYTWQINGGSQIRYKVEALYASTGLLAYSSGWRYGPTIRSFRIEPGYLVNGGSYLARLVVDDGNVQVEVS